MIDGKIVKTVVYEKKRPDITSLSSKQFLSKLFFSVGNSTSRLMSFMKCNQLIMTLVYLLNVMEETRLKGMRSHFIT